MNLYLISRPDLGGWDEYQSAVVCARSAEDARRMHPGCGYHRNGLFHERANKKLWKKEGSVCVWIAPSEVIVRRIGKARKLARGVVLTDFNAG